MKHSLSVLWGALLSVTLTSTFLLAEEPRGAALIELNLEFPAEVSALPAASTLVIRDAEGGEAEKVPLTGRSPVVALPPNSTWTVGLQAPGLWAPDQIVSTGPAETRTLHKVPVWQLATVRGIAKPAERDTKLPEALETRFEIGEESTPGEGTLDTMHRRLLGQHLHLEPAGLWQNPYEFPRFVGLELRPGTFIPAEPDFRW